ncbi:DUF3626 domain-containing protein [Roseateles sp. UC29_93]|uniref:DUF3626 domain-containing protein n=1 Tax=Roseateles sp. UC29_93 TaxID=3350177 RepID=UPI00366C821F
MPPVKFPGASGSGFPSNDSDIQQPEQTPGEPPFERRLLETLGHEHREILGQFFRADFLRQVFDDCEHTLEQDRDAALRRLRQTGVAPAQAQVLLDKMTAVLQDARLTINMPLERLLEFMAPGSGGEYLNCFARSGQIQKRPDYVPQRAKLEEQALGMHETLARSAYRDFGQYRSANGGDGGNPSFQWTSRPLYCAVDFLKSPRGGAQAYGKSYLVLAEHMKHVSTFSSVDSFARDLSPSRSRMVKPERICTWHHFPRLIVHAQNNEVGYNCLTTLKDAAAGIVGKVPARYGKGKKHGYIEAQIHGRLKLDRDVKEIHICRSELEQLQPESRRDALLKAMEKRNRQLGRRFFIVD